MMGVIVIFLAIVVSTLVIQHVYWLVDSSGARQFGYGLVVGKKFTKGYWKTTWQTRRQSNGKRGIRTKRYPRSTWIPDSYLLRIHVAHAIANESVSKELYESIDEGERVAVEYSQGRLSKDKVFIKEIENNIT